MKTRVKGNRIQLKAINELTIQGWLVGKTERTGKFIKIKDLFGLADLIAIKPNKVKFVQCTCNRPHTHLPYKVFALQYCGSCIQLEQWVWVDRKGWLLYEYLNNGGYTRTQRFKNNRFAGSIRKGEKVI